MTTKLKYKDITWINLSKPTKEEIAAVVKEFKLHSLVESELAAPSERSKVDVYDDFLYLILHFPTCHICYGKHRDNSLKGDDNDGAQEIDFIIGKDFLITAHYEPVDSLSEFAAIFENQLEFGSGRAVHGGHLFFVIIRQIYRSLEEGLEYINSILKKTEQSIFAGQEKEMVTVLADINRNLLDFRWSLKSHQEVLDSLDLAGRDFFGEKFAYFLHAILGEYHKIWNMLENNRETFAELRETNESLLTIKTNEIMKFLTIMAFVTFPLSVFTSLFGMNTINNPILGSPNDFWVIVGIMLGAVAIMFAWFRYKKWI